MITPTATAEYLQSEIDRLEKKTKVNLVMAVIMTLVVLAYSVFGLWFLGQLTDPTKLADYAIDKFTVDAPKVIEATEAKLIEQAPEAADKLSVMIQTQIPQIRFKAQEIISLMVAKQFNETDSKLEALVNAYFEAHSDKLQPRAANETLESYAKRIANSLSDTLGQNINEYLKETTHLTLAELRDRSTVLLTTLSAQTTQLAHSPKLTHRQELERFVIAYVINNYFKEVPLK